MYPSPKYDTDYAIMNGMASCADEVIHNISTAMMNKGMWANTLLIYTSVSRLYHWDQVLDFVRVDASPAESHHNDGDRFVCLAGHCFDGV
jgi:hypothetical protein